MVSVANATDEVELSAFAFSVFVGSGRVAEHLFFAQQCGNLRKIMGLQ
jgi:hypothetical protein